jgi:hypothetical protein
LDILDEEVEVSQVDVTALYDRPCWGLNCGPRG